MLPEITALVAFMGLLCFLIWNLRFYPAGSSKKTANTYDNSTAESNGNTLQDPELEKGRLLFHSYCNSCHYLHANGLGPSLAGARQRWEGAGSYRGKTGDEWLKMWIRNWKDVVAAGYPYGVMMAKSRENEMNMFINLTDRQIDLILAYTDADHPALSVTSGVPADTVK